MQKNNPKILNAWASYDWANSVYSLAITSAIFPAYYTAVTKTIYGADADNQTIVSFLGFNIESGVLLSYSLSFSFLIAAFLSPLLSGIADYGGKKKQMMKFFTYMGSSACLALYFFTAENANLEFGILMSIIASMGFTGALVFYNSFLPEIATPDKFDAVSAKGFSLGFLGSVIQLAISLVIILNPTLIGLGENDGGFATRLSFLFVGIWWIGFAQIAFYFLPKPEKKSNTEGKLFKKGFQELNKVWKEIKQLQNTKRFLFSFFFYNMGAYTIMLIAPIFGEKLLKLDTSLLILAILILQIVGIIGAYLFSFISAKIGNKKALLLMNIIWIIVAIMAVFVYDLVQFFSLAGAVGIVMGAIHLSRSTYAKLLPKDTKDTTSFFSFYDVTEKLSVVLGTFSFGLVAQITGSMRYSPIALSVFFLIGIIFLLTTQIPRDKKT